MATFTDIYVCGYLGLPTIPKTRKVETLRTLAERDNLLICDIRIKPWSMAPCWRKEAMQESLGRLYCHIPELGNRNYRGQFGEGFQIVDMDSGIAAVIARCEAAGRAPMLLCACDCADDCHRLYVAKEMHRRGLCDDVKQHQWRTEQAP